MRIKSFLAGKMMRLYEVFFSFFSVYHGKMHLFFEEKSRNQIKLNAKMAIVAHVYYIDQLNDVLKIKSFFPDNFDLFITTIEEKYDEISKLVASENNIHIVVNENIGRDIHPFVKLSMSGALDRYEFVLKIHTKKSPHLYFGNLRRKFMYNSLAGSRKKISEVVKIFKNPEIGLVGPKFYLRKRPVFWMKNKKRVEELCSEMVPPAPVVCCFFEGTMFWVRPSALMPLRSLNLSVSDYESENGQLDGTLHHAVERVFALSAMAAGYKIEVVS